MRQLHAVKGWHPVTPRLRGSVIRTRGPAAEEWIDWIPETVANLLNEWQLTVTGQPESGSFGCVMFAETQDGQCVVLKVPHTPEAGRSEIELITAWSPRGISPEPQAYDPRTGSYLMDRVRPGGEWIPPSGAVGAGEFVRVLDLAHLTDHHSQGSHLLTDRELLSMRATWAHEHATAANSAGLHSLITSAQALADVALEHATNRTLVHGDLAAKNLLRGQDGPQIIDPMPATGEREFDAALWATNQDGDTIFERIWQLWDLGFDYPKLLTWTSVLAALELRIGQRHSARQAEFLRDETVTEMLQLDELALDALDGIRLCTHQR